MLLLSGLTASGKNTIANAIATQIEPCTIIDFDSIRAMFANPHKTPWDGEEGIAQQTLGVNIVCDIAQRFKANGWNVIILDVLSTSTLSLYKERLCSSKLKIVQLLPNYKTILKRFDERGPVLTYEELQDVYNKQQELTGFDLRIDNSQISPEAITEQLINYWQP